MTRARQAALAALVALVALLVGGASTVAQERTFEGSASTVLVEVPVTVVHDGEPVRGLERDAFTVYEGRNQREIVDFEVVDLARVTGAAALDPGELPTAARRSFLFLFDFAFSRPGTVERAREAARQMVLHQLHPSDLVAVATYGVAGPKIVLGFTSDRAQIALALETLGVESLLDGIELTADPLQVMAVTPPDAQSALAFLAVPEGQGDGGPLGPEDRRIGRAATASYAFQDLVRQVHRQDRQQQTTQVTAMSDSLSDLAELIASAEGRKHVVFLSEGFDSELFLGQELDERATASLMRDGVASEDSDTTTRYGDTRLLADIDRMLDTFRRADAVIQAVDISGMEPGGSDAAGNRMTQQALFYFANETGGELFESYNNLDDALGEMLERNSVTYLLTFRADEIEHDGEYHDIRVEVADLPRRAKVAHRSGYFAPEPYSWKNPMEQRMATAHRLLAGTPESQFATAVLAPVFAGPTADAPAHVPVVVEIDGTEFLSSTEARWVAAELYVYALDPDGRLVDHFTRRVEVDTHKAGDALRRQGLKLLGSLDLAPGSYSVRVLAVNSASGASTLQAVELAVPEPDGSTATLLAPLFPRSREDWIVVPEPSHERRDNVASPFRLDGQAYLPAARAEIRPGEGTPIHLVSYNLESNATPELRARAVGPDGEPAGDVRTEIERRLPFAGDRAAALVARLVVQDLAPGTYTLEVTLTDPETGANDTSTVPVHVAGSL